MKQKEFNIKEHTNGIIFKQKNKRVCIMALPTNDYVIELKTLSDKLDARALHRVDRNQIVVTGIRISREAAIAIMVGLQKMLLQDGVL